jgi:hypothetical protein
MEADVRCHLMRSGQIAAVELLTDAADNAVIVQAEALFAKRKGAFTGFEVWDRTRLVHRHPQLLPKYMGDT